VHLLDDIEHLQDPAVQLRERLAVLVDARDGRAGGVTARVVFLVLALLMLGGCQVATRGANPHSSAQ